MALDYASLEAAIASWLASATGLAPASILGRNAKVPQPGLPYIEYTVPAAQPAGGRDDLRSAYDAGAAPGAEVVYQTRGNRETTVSVQVRSNPAVGANTARSYAEGAINALGLPPVLASLKAAGLGLIEVSGIRDLSDRSGPLGAGRVQFDVRFRLADGATSATGYIETVPITTSGIT